MKGTYVGPEARCKCLFMIYLRPGRAHKGNCPAVAGNYPPITPDGPEILITASIITKRGSGVKCPVAGALERAYFGCADVEGCRGQGIGPGGFPETDFGRVVTVRGLVLDQVAKGFEGVVAVDGLDLEIPPGEVYGLLGPNGAGKTTTIRMILGILEPDTGTIACGENGEVLSPDRVGYLPEERGLYPKMKVMDLLVFLGRIKSLPRSEAQDRAEIWLDRFDLQEWAKRPVEHLSKGMQQKVQFIATVMHDPDLLILDEPFSGLDPINAALFQDVLTELKVESKILILSTHQMEDAERLCDRVCLINRGTKVLDGPMADVKASFGSDRVRISFEGDDALLTDTSIVRSVETRERFLEVQLQPGPQGWL